MAFLDNPTIILAHIRQSHVTSDDTGMCEMVLIDHDVDLEKIHPPSMPGDSGSEIQGSNGETQGYVYAQSVDITSSWDFGIRRRSNTAQRLERLRKERQNQIKCKNIQWKERNSKQSAQELKSLFEKKSLKEKPPSSGKQSILSVRLEQCPLQLNNPFNEYSKFDGKGHVGTTATKKIDVYLPLHSSQDRLLPMTVVTMASARVQDLIGLICWQYTSEGREPKLNDNVSAYCLHIAEDDGEVDTDFPPLDSNEPIHKFGFSTLALVEKYSSPGLTSKESLFVRINAAHGFSLIQVDNTKVTMKEILLKAVKRRKGSQKISVTHTERERERGRDTGRGRSRLHAPGARRGIRSRVSRIAPWAKGPQYRLEKQSEPNVAVDLESTLESQSAWEFCLVRENSSRADGVFEEDSQIDIATVQDMLSSHHYKSFKVSMIHRLRFTTDVQLGISGDKIEIDPVTNQKASTKFWIKQKPISIDSDLLCACDLAEEKSPSHAIFKLTYLSNHDYKHLYFESDAATVNEIVLKVNYILESRASTARADYFAQKQRKLNRRTSFSFQKEKKSGQQ
ncbi:target of rapamycin complex 2 subunit MAPKAP1 isoform X1 [Canis lupus dingo]|uniref:target of rapamycin complex 2 subunit MAPKAP1 isoform X1 n=2 Tax=Canis lupus dingo TaxID=286419 RepID=UPI0020C4A747|nr:target of rapamycin complex 2 subunit MAPKAP1 isoform X1 [Canis lupus dingo]XP_048970976.1 target of rapamycin complex 2 subunit MAPKAP1 isoform X1 [Canis lupus dingo]XP_048970977.1 target of rapamycin complex 2 subunit MAPKAP1 isoform X1 [Canis lupus dingo]XP_048970978.1 target of rapamycin complex 2 subunit MAPKAP1 isoform X1 [Canis lupus dingo]XP_048970979.1 target of rapamycin complex 2 subunit MAPKAP1 isoform X1 [Canis lupus dingo]XP_048970980.1 target of rapamycin complex 2 subunit MA